MITIIKKINRSQTNYDSEALKPSLPCLQLPVLQLLMQGVQWLKCQSLKRISSFFGPRNQRKTF